MIKPERVVILGGSGFVGRALEKLLLQQGIRIMVIGSRDLDLAQDYADRELVKSLKPGDSVVALAALTPDRGRDVDTLMKNIAMARNCVAALKSVEVAHIVYVSSDAVYPMAAGRISEDSSAEPSDLYGAMHHTREIIFRELGRCPLAILRPTLIYGPNEPHNSYGPNRFRRMAREQGRISLGGEGEETRDHIYVDDVARLISLCLHHSSEGLLNIATGSSHSFRDVAQIVKALWSKPIEIIPSKRTSPVTHRSFDVTERIRAFPDFSPTDLETGLKLTIAAELTASNG